MKKKTIPIIITILAVAVVFVLVEFIRFSPINGKRRYICFFKDAISGRTIYETRMLEQIQGVDNIRLFAEELLLGPFSHKAKRIFPRECSVEFCFLQDGILYLSLSDGILPASPNSGEDLKENLKLYEKNLRRNFRNIRQIKFFCNNEEINL